MNTAFYLSTCSTCQKILAQINLPESVKLQDIKTNKISLQQLEEMKRLSGSYEGLFSRRAMKYRSLGLDKKELREEDYKNLILEEYTFLKRPVFVLGEQIFIGNSKKVIEALDTALNA